MGEDSNNITHQPCERCGGSDCCTYFSNGWVYCHSNCGSYQMKGNSKVFDDLEKEEDTAHPVGDKPENYSASNVDLLELYDKATKSLPDRGITVVTTKKFHVVEHKGKVYYFYFNPNDNTVPVAAKVRYGDKKFATIGDWGSTGLYGQNLFQSGGLAITITEGEYDALACYQMFGSKYPVVSIKNGANGALRDCSKREVYDYLNSFDKIVISFDNDEPGRDAAAQVAGLFGPKAHVMEHRDDCKDACDYLKKSLNKDFVSRWYSAQPHQPDGIVSMADLKQSLKTPVTSSPIQWPWAGLNDKLYGLRDSELVIIAAGTGLGKTTVMRELINHLLITTDLKLGLAFLEETPERTARGLAGLAINKPIHKPDVVYSEQDIEDAFEQYGYDNRVFYWDHWGSNNIEAVENRFTFFAKALGCKIGILDHVSMLVSDGENGDERKELDKIMTRLGQLCRRLNMCLIVVSHMTQPDGTPLEEGGATKLRLLRGSRSLGQLSDAVIGLERDSQHDDEVQRNTTRLRVLKNRFCGDTGPACELYYNKETGRLEEIMIKREVL